MGSKERPFPSREEILEFIRESPKRVGRREIARAFRLGANHRLQLKKVFAEMKADGSLGTSRRRRGKLPTVTMLRITGADDDGDLLARPLDWDDEAAPPLITMAPERPGRPALGPGDRVLARLKARGGNSYEARTIRRVSDAPRHVLGLYGRSGSQGRLRPTDRRYRGELTVAAGNSLDARPGDLVRAEILPGRRLGAREARIIERLDGGSDSFSLMAIHGHDIPTEFSPDALAQAAAAEAAHSRGRDDLRHVPFVTIDGADARDFDDAVWAERDGDGGWRLRVAIADVAWYVRPGDALDRCARERGNSVYFPDRVVPMLPQELSNGWCSLVPDEDRPCLVADMSIGADGTLRRHRFGRVLMRSVARLTYNQVQAARDGAGDGAVPRPEIDALYGAYGALAEARRRRGVLELELPERRVVLDGGGAVTGVEIRPRYDSHRLIEEFMIAANVAAAETIEKLGHPCMYRIHDEPPADRIETLKELLKGIGVKLARGQGTKAAHFNRILARVADTPHAAMVNQAVLRSQAQAEYSPANIGHFGLALRRYAHFTSPIRRYADLLVHRALIGGLGLGAGGWEKDPPDLAELGQALSAAERRATAAERDAMDRFSVAFLADRIGARFSGRINGVTRFGLFVTLDESGADGLVPMRSLPEDYYVLDKTGTLLKGRRKGRRYRLGQAVEVLLAEADPATGSLILNLTDA